LTKTDGFADICQCHFLGSRNNNGLGIRDQLGNGQGFIPGSRRGVDNQKIQYTPADFPDKLLYDAMFDRSPPDNGFVLVMRQKFQDQQAI
jgi:hypothetical protein